MAPFFGRRQEKSRPGRGGFDESLMTDKMSSIWRSGGLDVADGDLAGAAVRLSVKGDFLTLVEGRDAGPLQSRGVDEHVLAAIVRLDEAETLLTIVELYGARVHGDILSLA